MVKKMFFATLLATALSLSALAAHQLRTGTHAVLACGSPCTSSDVCKRPCFCYGLFDGRTVGNCQPEGPAPARPR
jgi:hypothetical protein